MSSRLNSDPDLYQQWEALSEPRLGAAKLENSAENPIPELGPNPILSGESLESSKLTFRSGDASPAQPIGTTFDLATTSPLFGNTCFLLSPSMLLSDIVAQGILTNAEANEIKSWANVTNGALQLPAVLTSESALVRVAGVIATDVNFTSESEVAKLGVTFASDGVAKYVLALSALKK